MARKHVGRGSIRKEENDRIMRETGRAGTPGLSERQMRDRQQRAQKAREKRAGKKRKKN